MRHLSYSRLLTLICFVLFVGAVASCKKDKDDTHNDGSVQLFSFGPTGAKHGDTIRFIGQNLDKVTAIEFTGTNAVVNQKEFKQQTPDLILLVVPAGAEKGTVKLKTAGGDIVSKTAFNLNVKTAASIAALPKQARPGENITLTGNYLNWVNRITFARNKVVTKFVSQSLTQLVVTVPQDAETGPLLLTFSGTDTIDIKTPDTLQVALPVYTSMNPLPVEREKNLTITGTNLDLVQGVQFKGKTTPETAFVSKTATQLVVKVPKEASKGKIELIAYSGIRVTSIHDLTIVGDLPPLADFPFAIYTDALQNGYQDWSYTDVHDFNNTTIVRQGTKAIKAVYADNGFQGITFHSATATSTA
ncbi:MAG: IPT/TIG domain-containing protein, partial [Bacteroidota bacterium]|nr:IPT/TIG domain-containing protein [Bacteroidota bacterium]